MKKLNESSLRIDAVALLNVLKTAKRLGAFNVEFCSEAEIKRDFLHSNVFSKPEDVEGNLFGLSPVFFLLDEMGLSFIVDIEGDLTTHFVFIQFEDIDGLAQFYLEVLGVDEVDFLEMLEFSMN